MGPSRCPPTVRPWPCPVPGLLRLLSVLRPTGGCTPVAGFCELMQVLSSGQGRAAPSPGSPLPAPGHRHAPACLWVLLWPFPSGVASCLPPGHWTAQASGAGVAPELRPERGGFLCPEGLPAGWCRPRACPLAETHGVLGVHLAALRVELVGSGPAVAPVSLSVFWSGRGTEIFRWLVGAPDPLKGQRWARREPGAASGSPAGAGAQHRACGVTCATAPPLPGVRSVLGQCCV